MKSTNEILVLSEELEKLLSRTSDDLTSTLVNLSGSLKDIECGTHIKIPTAVGFVSYFKSSENFETLTLNLREKISEKMTTKQKQFDDEDEDLFMTKS